MTNKIDETADAPSASRGTFLAAAGGAAFSFTIVPRHVPEGSGFTPQSEWVNVAGIGAAGTRDGDIAAHAKHGANIGALCDVDDERVAGSLNAFPKARRFKDFRQWIDKEVKHIDAVTLGAQPIHPHRISDRLDLVRESYGNHPPLRIEPSCFQDEAYVDNHDYTKEK